jgi:peroxiredoxin
VRYERVVKTAAMLAQVGFIGAAALGVYAFVGAAQHDMRRASCTALCKMRPAYAGLDRKAPDFELADMHGQRVKLSQYRGKVVVLNFWTQSCDPCKEEMPSLADLAKIGETRGDFVVLTVSTDAGPDAVRDLLKVLLNGQEPPFPVLFDPEIAVVKGRYGTTLFPETWIIDRDGVIRARFDGAKDWASPLAIEVIGKVAAGSTCPTEFYKNEPRGNFAGLCDDDS